MKLKTTILPLCTAFLGVLGIILRFWNNTAGTDPDGLTITGHPSTIAMTVLLIGVAVLLAVFAIFMDKTPTTPGKSTAGAVGCYIGALGLLITAIMELGAMSVLEEQFAFSQLSGLLSVVFGFGAVAVFVLMGNCRKKGKPMNVWAYAVIVAFFVFHLLQQYQLWTRQPQVGDYLFPLLGSIGLMLTTYHRACKDLGQPAQWQYLVLSQAALFFCMMSMGGQSRVFYITMAAWTLLDSLPGKEMK